MKLEHALTDRRTGKRNSNLELFRIITMLLIVAHHYVVNSGIRGLMYLYPFAYRSMFLYVAGAWGKIGINCFVMITGYFMCKSNITLKKFVKLIFQIEFYKIVIYFVFAICGYEEFSVKHFLKVLLPVTEIKDGFVQCFIVLFLLIPFLNVLIRHISEVMHLRLIIICLVVYSVFETLPGFSVTYNYVSWFIVIYFIASYIRLYPKRIFNKTIIWFVSFVITVILSVVSIFACLKLGFKDYYFIMDSNKILAFITALCAFMFFKNLKIKYNPFINVVASASFGVLLIHANSNAMRQWLWKDTLNNMSVFHQPTWLIHFICSVLGIYIVCTCIDLVRLYLLEKPMLKLYDKLFPKISVRFYQIEDKVLNKFHIQK